MHHARAWNQAIDTPRVNHFPSSNIRVHVLSFSLASARCTFVKFSKKAWGSHHIIRIHSMIYLDHQIIGMHGAQRMLN